jgi:protein O-mannosyl-transferase
MARKPVARTAKAAAKPIKSNSARLQDIAAGALLFCAILVAYIPALKGGPLWDDDGHMTRPDLQSLHGLWRIWFEFGATQQYYPILHSAFWVEHRMWGDAVLGYHLTDIVLHATAACLVVAIMRRLSLPGAWLAGFIFALHPVCVETAAWISEQKNTLSAAFYLGSALAYLNFDRTRRRPLYFLALGLFVLALLSKTVTATLPAALLVVFWWQRGKLSWKRDVVPLLPWFVLGASAGLFTAWIEKTTIGAQGPDFALTLAQRILLAGRVIWFYLGKLLWPVNLTFIYPRWTIDTGVWWQYLFPAGVLALAAGLWLLVRRRGPLAGFLFFVGTLFPALGFLNVYPFAYSYVADHFQYLASLGIIVPLASGLTVGAERISRNRAVKAACAVTLLLTLGVLTWRQSRMYQDSETLYQETLARNPGCWLAHNNLGSDLLEVPGRLPEAIGHIEAALRLQPHYPEVYNNMGSALLQVPGRLPDAIANFETALRLRPGYPEAYNNLGIALSRTPDRLPDAITDFETALRIRPNYARAENNLGIALSNIPGRRPDAIAHFEAAARMEPDDPQARFNLGNVLSRIPGRLPDAIAEYEAALRIRPDYPQALDNLGSALSTIPGRLPDAIAEYEAALRIDPDLADAHYNLGLALSQTPGRLPDAIAEYKEALRLRPDLESARRMLEILAAVK